MQDFMNIIGQIGPAIAPAIGAWAAGKYGGDSSKGGLNSLASIIQHAGNISSSNITPNSAKKLLFVSEDKLLELCGKFTRYQYGGKRLRYPYDVPNSGVKAQTHDRSIRTINCVTFAEALLAKAWLDEHPNKFTWNKQDHKDMMISNRDQNGNTVRRFSPVEVAVKRKIAKEVVDSCDIAQPEPWMIVQGWNESRTKGHCFLIWKVDGTGDNAKILTLESNRAYLIDGVGFRKIGNIDSYIKRRKLSAPDGWKTNTSVWTWIRFKQKYPAMKLAKLNVTLNS